MPDPPPPPPPPPHGQNPRPPGGLPDGNYDIFIIPPHSAGSGFLYLPSLQPHRNSFIAGAAVALVAVGIYAIVMPVLKAWLATVMAGNAWGVLVLVIIVGAGAWAFGKTSVEGAAGADPPGGNTGGAGASAQQQSGAWGAPPRPQSGPEPQPTQSAPKPESAQTGWEKARDETRKREEARKRAEEMDRKRAEGAKAREEAERAAKAKAEKEKWEQARAREKEQREREARERLAKEKRESTPDRDRVIRERIEKLRKEREERERQKAASSPSATGRASPRKEYVRPTAKSYAGTDDEYSFRPYDTPPPPPKPKPPAHKASSASSISGVSDSSYAPSHTTARTTPPPSMRGPYSTTDPDKIQIKGVYLFNDSFPTKPVSQLVVAQAGVTDGLILNIRTEGLFIDDDVRKVPQREWDVKAWTLKLVEDGSVKGAALGAGHGLHVLRATLRNADSSKYCFVLDEAEGWKVAVGLQRLRKGSQVRSLGMSGMKEAEVKGLLGALGWL